MTSRVKQGQTGMNRFAHTLLKLFSMLLCFNSKGYNSQWIPHFSALVRDPRPGREGIPARARWWGRAGCWVRRSPLARRRTGDLSKAPCQKPQSFWVTEHKHASSHERTRMCRRAHAREHWKSGDVNLCVLASRGVEESIQKRSA